MILERTMMFGLTLRKVMPISSGNPTLACVVLAWIQRLKYLANSTNRTKAKMTTTTPKTIRIVGQSSLAARCANRSRFINGSSLPTVVSERRRSFSCDPVCARPQRRAPFHSTEEFVQGPVLGHAHAELAGPDLN